MFGLDAPPPSGPPSPELMQWMLRAAASRWFCWKVNTWNALRYTGAFNWDAFQLQLGEARYREYKDKWQGKRSIGWAGPDSSGPQWLFGVCRLVRRLWLIGRSILDHELFHAAQDLRWNGQLFRPPVRLRWWQEMFVEAEAMLFGSPLIGLPFLLLQLACVVTGVWMLWVVIDALMRVL